MSYRQPSKSLNSDMAKTKTLPQGGEHSCIS